MVIFQPQKTHKMTTLQAVAAQAYIICDNLEQRSKVVGILERDGLTFSGIIGGEHISVGCAGNYWFVPMTATSLKESVHASVFIAANRIPTYNTNTDPIRAFTDLISTLPDSIDKVAILDAAYAMTVHHVREYMDRLEPLRTYAGEIRSTPRPSPFKSVEGC